MVYIYYSQSFHSTYYVVRAAIFHLLGLFCELYPEYMVALSDRLIGIFMRTLKSEVNDL